MTFSPRTIVAPDPVFVGTYSHAALGNSHKGLNVGALGSGAYGAANRVHYVPFYIARPYAIARWWWHNGATVGTNYIQIGVYDESLNLCCASPKTLSAGTTNYVQFANPGISGRNITSGGDSTDQDTYTTASVTLKAGRLYLMSVENSHATDGAAVSSIDSATAGYPTFTSRSSTPYNSTNYRISIWSAVPTSDWTGALRVQFGASSGTTGACWSVDEFLHVDTATNDGVVQQATGTGNSTTPLATLGAFGSANNATFGAFGAASPYTVSTPSAGYFELADNTIASPTQGMQTVYRPDNDTTVDSTLAAGAAQWGACAVEIKSLGTGAISLPPMRGYLAIWCNGTTATIFRLNTSIPMESEGTYIQSSQATGLPQSATFAVSPGTTYNFGFTSRSSP